MDPGFLLLLACFMVSGFAALLYQTVWTRELSFVFGTSELAVVAVLAAYMAGLALGAAAAARFAARLRRPVRAYGVLELAIAVCALLVPFEIRIVNAVYVRVLGGAESLAAAGSTAAIGMQLAGAFIVLLPPTAFMGATLPLLARHAVHRDDEIATRVGALYAINTAGAIAGTVCAAFWLMPSFGLRRTVWVGVALNALVFGLATLLARRAPVASTASSPIRVALPNSEWLLPAIALSGAISFSYEVMWTRLLGHLLGSSIQGFATMLASFLLGIALGSAIAGRLATTRERAIAGFAFSQLGIALTSYVAFALADKLPALSLRLGAGPGQPLASAAVAGAVLLPITLCIGATFPFAVRAMAPDPDRTADTTARVYSWNTVGAIFGALAAGFVLLPRLGFEGLLTAGVASSLVLAALSALAAPSRRWVPAALALAGGIALVLSPATTPWSVLTASALSPRAEPPKVVYAAVGRTSTVLLTETGTRFQILTGGLPESYVEPIGALPVINVAHWLGALPALVRPGAKDVLVIGLGGGLALERMPKSYERVDVIEIEPQVLEANRRISQRRARDPLADPRVQVHIGDARGSLQLTSRRYDAIVSQPSHPWTAGASHLYTREFFDLVRSRLAPDGVFVQWIGLAFVDEALLRSLLSALVEAFPHVEVFQPQPHGLLFVGSAAPIDVLGAAAQALGAAPSDFAQLGLHRLEDFASAWALDERGVAAVALGAAPNTDDDNQLAARSARLGDAKLEPDTLRNLIGRYDPLRDGSSLDRPTLIRSLLNRRMIRRATDLAMAGEGADEEVALGWVERAQGRSGRAARHFTRALSLTPGNREAIAGLVALANTDATYFSLLSDTDLSVPEVSAVVAGKRYGEAGDWEALARLDSALALLRPGQALFEPATRLRIARLLAAGDPESAREAESLADTLVLRSWYPNDALLRARAAIAAGRPEDARAALRQVASEYAAGRPALAEEMLRVAHLLSDEDRRAIQALIPTVPSAPARLLPAAVADGEELRALPEDREIP
ncbi:MAG TPA: fused MFS/spermidine synthase [Myxococcota bacterium]|nr:fused MFS/spermidine synthase [Myxococcota bacterium]